LAGLLGIYLWFLLPGLMGLLFLLSGFYYVGFNSLGAAQYLMISSFQRKQKLKSLTFKKLKLNNIILKLLDLMNVTLMKSMKNK
jgi:hypothetical protein